MVCRFVLALCAAWCAAKRAFREAYSGHALADDPVQQESNVPEVIVEAPSPRSRNSSVYNLLGVFSPLITPSPQQKFSRNRPKEFVDLASPFEKALHLLRKVMSKSLPPEVLEQLHQALKLLDESVGAGANRVDIAAELTRQTGKVKMDADFEDCTSASLDPPTSGSSRPCLPCLLTHRSVDRHRAPQGSSRKRYPRPQQLVSMAPASEPYAPSARSTKDLQPPAASRSEVLVLAPRLCPDRPRRSPTPQSSAPTRFQPLSDFVTRRW